MIEIIRPVKPASIRSVLFDFDGTLSLIREGWQEVMICFMIGILHPLEPWQPEDDVRRYVTGYVTRLTGKQTIYQMIQLAEEVRSRGGVPEEPLVYKRQYHDRLWERVRERIRGLECGQYRPDDWLVPGSREALEYFQARGLRLYLASGTDQAFVSREAELLDLTRFFDDRIFGALDQYRLFSKKMLIERVISEQDLRGAEFVAFGDGYVEIENTREVNGTAVGVASDERLRGGRLDAWKRERLIAAGANLIVPDLTEHQGVWAYLTRANDEE